MSKKAKFENLTVMRSVHVPLTQSEIDARKTELPLIIQRRKGVESRKKDANSGFKAEMDEIADTEERLVGEINSGKTIQDLLCPKRPNLADKTWEIIHPTTGEVMESEPMKWSEVEALTQTEIPIDDEGAEAAQEVVVEAPSESPLLMIEAAQEEAIEGEVVEGEDDEEGKPEPPLAIEGSLDEAVGKLI